MLKIPHFYAILPAMYQLLFILFAPDVCFQDGDDFPIYNKLDITNEHDLPIKDTLDHVETIVNQADETRNQEGLTKALAMYDKLLLENEPSPRLLFQKAETLDLLAQLERSNVRLEQAISTFHQVLTLAKVPDKLFKMAGNKCVDLLKFRGWYENAIEVQKKLLSRFPNMPDEINKLGTLLLYVNKNSEAKIVFEQFLQEYPNNGYALVHLGFILKLEGSANDKEVDPDKHKVLKQLLEKGAQFMEKGIQTRDSGVMEGKFFFHLGDALRRLGKTVEADKVYEEAAKEGAMLSFWQRSLYNVKGLKATPIWSPEELSLIHI